MPAITKPADMPKHVLDSKIAGCNLKKTPLLPSCSAKEKPQTGRTKTDRRRMELEYFLRSCVLASQIKFTQEKLTALTLLCTPDVIRLIHYGYLASSPDCPQTAFSIRLLQFHYHLFRSAVVSNSAFVKALCNFLDSRSQRPSYSRGGKYRKRVLWVPFSYSVDLYACIQVNCCTFFREGLQLTPTEQWASKCPRCFGPRENEVKAHQDEPTIIVALDGNFQQRHYAYASKDDPLETQYPKSFIPPSKISPDATEFAATEASAVGIDPPCSDSHKAANDTRGETSWEKCDDNGLFASTCCHNIPLMFVNIYKTGKKLYYPVSILQNLLEDFPEEKFGILYDLGCHLESHVRKRNLLSNQHSDLTFATSVFHAYVHEWLCQVKYNPRLNMWWGLSDGNERLWAFLSPLISILRVSTRMHRFNSIDSWADYFTNQLNEMAAHWLFEKLEQAETVYASSSAALEKLHTQPNLYAPGNNYTNEFLENQCQLEKSYHLNSNQSSERQKIELGRLLCMEAELDQACSWRHKGDFLAKVWYAKTELRQGFLALVEEKQPLIHVTRAGKSTTLGTRGQQKILEALRKRAGNLRTVLDSYNSYAQAFIASNPNRPAPTTITYSQLLALQADDMFWNDGLFTNASEPWAVDPLTQQGIRHLAYYNQALEEKRCLGWEARSAIRWATEHHSWILSLLTTLFDGVPFPDESTPNQMDPLFPKILLPLLNHPLIQSIPFGSKLEAVALVLHTRLIELTTLQLDWNKKLQDVFERTSQQSGDAELLSKWKLQVERIQKSIDCGLLMAVPGEMAVELLGVMNGDQLNTLPLPLEDDQDEDEDLEETYLADIEQIMSTTMLADLEREAGTNA
ncbi:hypothetical protein PTTG_25626 [Puccinia triticina 1-1 BBBD Race 1]|uniref:CxC1 domain-containing protein n=1 Tax=Puccinia triticina (isolate 1-1 / race 1 (BBBD)) TaxID=630390 RepID=A0A180H129_PUCT1|nr:hypothetical protein PTTG_25626 [Puccinia triticina 1-1 BBBD Race 1]